MKSERDGINPAAKPSGTARLGERMVDEFPTFAPAWRIVAVSTALGGNQNFKKATKKALELDPLQRRSVLASHLPLRRTEDREKWEEGLLRAGFPQYSTMADGGKADIP